MYFIFKIANNENVLKFHFPYYKKIITILFTK